MAKAVTFVDQGMDMAHQLATAAAEKHKVGGVCASFAFDFIKKRLANKPMDATTYKNKSRLEKIAKRHALQTSAKDYFSGLEKVASAYNLKITAAPTWYASIDAFANLNNVKGDSKIFGLYYVSCEMKGLESHAFAIDARGTTVWLADSGSGVYTSKDNCIDVTMAHVKALVNRADFKITNCALHLVTLK